MRQGKEKIPRCGLLFLGEARKGKTSLYKLIVGKEFDPKQKSTRGIDNNEVDTVDSRAISMNWSEKSEEDQQKEREESHASALLRELPDLNKQSSPPGYQTKSLEELIRTITNIDNEINANYKRKSKKRVKNPKDFLIFGEPYDGLYEEMFVDGDYGDDDEDDLLDDVADIAATVKKEAPTQNAPPQKAAPQSTPPQSAPEPKKPPSKPKPRQVSETTTSLSSSPPKKSASVPDTQKPTKLPRPNRSASLDTRERSLTINKALKKGKKERNEPTLLLNVLDFAGQKNYRPMHHCFIRRRSMYIVVFNLRDMLNYLREGKSQPLSYNPVEEVRYWLHSIHSHIYPPEKDKREKDELQRRVLLVGTHRNPGQGKEVTENYCKKINEFFEENILKDERCVDHIRTVSGQCFIAVENSCSDPIESGAKIVRDTLHDVKSDLQFLSESYPISWLRFESRLIDLKKRPNQKMCVQVEEVRKIAEDIGVPNPDDALEFFHDIGEIILLGE